MRSCRPYFRNHAITTIPSGQFLLINSIIITVLITLYVAFYEQENFSNLKDLANTQYLAILFFAIFTVVSSLIIIELQREDVVITGFLLQTLSSVFLIAIGVMLFGEKISVVQFLGIAMVIIGLYFVTQFKDDDDEDEYEDEDE